MACGLKYQMGYKSQICKCGGILEVNYKSRIKIPKSESFWDYQDCLPTSKYKRLMLGGTRMLEADEKNLILKLELYNPTRSFKDRGSVIEAAKAREYGYKTLAVASTGNMAYSLSYYSKIYEIKAHVFISKSASRDKIYNIMKTHDAVLHKVNGDFSNAQAEAILYARKNSAFLAGDYCYRKEGQKTLAYEIITQCENVRQIIVPVGNATLISGIYKGLCEMKASGNISSLPRLIAVQAEKCAPLAKAFNNNSRIVYEKPRTAADAIAVGMPTFGNQAIEAIRNTKGMALTITEKEMVKRQQQLYEKYGILAELASSAVLAAYYKMQNTEKGKTVAIISGGNV
jgi:threonine synthase